MISNAMQLQLGMHTHNVCTHWTNICTQCKHLQSQELAADGRAVVSTIHQPSSRLYTQLVRGGGGRHQLCALAAG